jgi:positive regulator of sigma E activity
MYIVPIIIFIITNSLFIYEKFYINIWTLGELLCLLGAFIFVIYSEIKAFERKFELNELYLAEENGSVLNFL